MLMFLILFGAILFGSTSQINVRGHEAVKWVLGDTVSASQLDPAGLGVPSYGTLYVARTYIQGAWIPGKGFFRDETFHCAVASNGEEITKEHCQALVAETATTSWIPKPDVIPTYAVVVGFDPFTHVDTFVCRGIVEVQYTLIGKLLKGENICRLPHLGETKIENYEVLVNIS